MAGDADAPAGQVDVLEGEVADGPGAGGVHGGQGDGQALGGSGGRLLDSLDLLRGQRQHGPPRRCRVGSANVKPRRLANRNSERSTVMALQRRWPRSGSRTASTSLEVTSRRWPRVAPSPRGRAAPCRSGSGRGVRPGAGAGVTAGQHHQPGTDVAAEPGGQLAGAAVDPGPDRRGGVVVPHPQLGEDPGNPDSGAVAARPHPLADLRQRDRAVAGVAGQDGLQPSAGRPLASLADVVHKYYIRGHGVGRSRC